MAEEVLCKGCGAPFISSKTLQHISGTPGKRHPLRSAEVLRLCRNCRRQAFASELLGPEPQRVERIPHVAKRRKEKLQPVRED